MWGCLSLLECQDRSRTRPPQNPKGERGQEYLLEKPLQRAFASCGGDSAFQKGTGSSHTRRQHRQKPAAESLGLSPFQTAKQGLQAQASGVQCLPGVALTPVATRTAPGPAPTLLLFPILFLRLNSWVTLAKSPPVSEPVSLSAEWGYDGAKALGFRAVWGTGAPERPGRWMRSLSVVATVSQACGTCPRCSNRGLCERSIRCTLVMFVQDGAIVRILKFYT